MTAHEKVVRTYNNQTLRGIIESLGRDTKSQWGKERLAAAKRELERRKTK
jgi:hypothetical protein